MRGYAEHKSLFTPWYVSLHICSLVHLVWNKDKKKEYTVAVLVLVLYVFTLATFPCKR